MKISAQGVSVRLGTMQALRNVDFEAAPGSVTGLIGPNGSGKTTLLRSLAGLQTVDAGRICCGDVETTSIAPRALARQMSYLSQGGDVHWPIRAESLVALGRLPHRGRFGGGHSRDADVIAKAMQDTDTTQFRDRTVDSLSGGERLRVLLARALAVEAPVLLADEPIAALDPLHQLQTMSLLRRKADEKITVVVVLHDLAIAVRFCDRLVLMSGGQILAQGGSDAVLTDANLAAAFHIQAIRGAHNGHSFVLPWSPVNDTGGVNDRPN